MIRFHTCVALTSLLCLGAMAQARASVPAQGRAATAAAQEAERGWLGITIEEDTAKNRVVVVEVVPASPAQKAGLKSGDAIAEVNGTSVKNYDQFLDTMLKGRVGQRFVFQVLRDDKKLDVDVVLGPRPGQNPKSAEPKKTAAAAATAEAPQKQERRGYLGVEIESTGDAVLITRVVPGSAADIAGLLVGDRVSKVKGKKIQGMDQFISEVQKAGAGNELELEVLRKTGSGEWKPVTAKPVLGAAMPAPQPMAEQPKAEQPKPTQPMRLIRRPEQPAEVKKPEQKQKPKPKPEQPRAGTAVRGPSKPTAWLGDLQKAAELSKKSNRPLLIDFGAEWCKPCKMLDESFADPRVQALISHAVLVKIDTDQNQKLADEYGVHGIPHVVVKSPQGKVVGTFTGYLAANELQERLKGFFGKAGVEAKAMARAAAPAQRAMSGPRPVEAARSGGITVTEEMVEQFRKEVAEIARKEAQEVVRQELRRFSQQLKKQMEQLRGQMQKSGSGEKDDDLHEMMENMLRMQKEMLEQMEKVMKRK